MASLKPLKSVAHNLPHHFASTLNWWGDDYAINHLARAVNAWPERRIEIDVLQQSSEPPLQGVARDAVAAMSVKLQELVAKAGYDSSVLSSASIVYDFGVSRSDPARGLPCYDCKCTLRTATGQTYFAMLSEESN